jgi:deoxycytidylate deaminase
MKKPVAGPSTPRSVKDNLEASVKEQIIASHTPELVIALCGPIGSPLRAVGEELKSILRETFHYDECKVIRLSEFIRQHAKNVDVEIPTTSAYDRIQALITAGNKLRETYGRSVLAELAIHEIRLEREQVKTEQGDSHYRPRKVCHIIDSIKNQEELELLRVIYREMVHVIGVFAPLALRESNLRAKMPVNQVYQLIDRDSGEEVGHGQNVGDTFPRCDFFLRIESSADSHLRGRVERFIHLVLGTKVITPTPSEAAMYAAAMAATSSACLSRQVGAAVTDEAGTVIGIGWNDVPKFGGGLYTSTSPAFLGDADQDFRCWNRDGGKCFNDEEKSLFADEMLRTLEAVLPAEKHTQAREALLENSKLKGLIEFSRAIHAEMHAIISASRVGGDALVGGKLYVTTYPCHSCARHIVVAGIKEVYYIEPYRKSLAVRLHGDAVSEIETDEGKVRFLAFEGVAPSRYLSLFKMAPSGRKSAGRMIKVVAADASPKLEKSLEALPALEAVVVKSLISKNLVADGGTDDDAPSPLRAA